jgi:hypothetical protein
MVKGVSIKNAKLYEICRGLNLSGANTDALFEKIAVVAEQEARKLAGKDMEIALAADAQDIDQKLAELQARKAVIANLQKGG